MHLVRGILMLKSDIQYSSRGYLFSSVKRVLLFGGQGNQEKGILDKFINNDQALKLIKQQSQKLQIDLLQIATTDSNNLINVTQYTQPLLLMSQYLQLHYGQKSINMSQLDRQNTYLIGHSLGEYTALTIAGAIDLSQCLRLVQLRGKLMAEASEGQSFGTLIIKFRQDKLPKILEQVQRLSLEVSCYNSPTNIVVSGLINNLTQLKDYMKKQLRIVSKVLPAATAFHSTHLQRMKEQFGQVLGKVDFRRPECQVLRNVDCKLYEQKKDIVEGLLLQNTMPVLFRQSIETLIQKEGKENLQFIEIGHKEYLNRWVQEVFKLY